MPSQRSTKNTSSNNPTVLMSTALPPSLYKVVYGSGQAKMMSMSDIMRTSLSQWLDEGAPKYAVVDEKFKHHIGAYISEDLYIRLRNVAKRRGISMSLCLRMAIAYCHQ